MSESFNPWLATFEEAQRRQDLHGNDVDPCGPIYQWATAQQLTAERAGIESGTGFDVLAAVAGCALNGLAMPDWLASAFLKRYRHVQQLRGKSWDEEAAFGAPYPKNAQLPAMRRRRWQRLVIGRLVHEFVERHPDLPMSALWSQFGPARSRRGDVHEVIAERARQVGVSKSTAQTLYAQAIDSGMAIDHNAMRERLRGQLRGTDWRSVDTALREFVKSPG